MNRRWIGTAAIILAVLCVCAGTWQGWPWYATTIACIALLLFALLEFYEHKAVNPKYIALVATISAVASVGRAVIQGLPGFQPATFFVMTAGFVFGPAAGTAVGVFTAVGSNIFLGEGTWTPWQMGAWGLVGFTSGLLGQIRPKLRVWWLIPFGAVWGYLFGWLMNTSVLLGGTHASLPAYFALCVQSVWFDTNHALANVVFLAVAGPLVCREFERFRRRFDISDQRYSALSK